MNELMGTLRNPAQRLAIRDELARSIRWRWSDIYISSVGSQANLNAIGKTLFRSPKSVAKNLLKWCSNYWTKKRAMQTCSASTKARRTCAPALKHPFATIISDGFYVKGRPHPRLHGTFPLLLGTYSREKSLAFFRGSGPQDHGQTGSAVCLEGSRRSCSRIFRRYRRISSRHNR